MGLMGRLGHSREGGSSPTAIRAVATLSLNEHAAVWESCAGFAVRPLLAIEADAGVLIITGFVEGVVNADEAGDGIELEHP